jgi:outer membrane protein
MKISGKIMLASAMLVSLAQAATTDVAKNINVSDVVSSLESKADLKIRFIDTFDAMRSSKEGQEVSKELENKRKELAKNIEAEEKKVAQAMTEYRGKASTLSDVARNKEEQKLTKMKRDYEAMVQGSEEELKLVMQQKTEMLAKEVDKAVTQIAKAEGLDAVVDRMSGRVIYASQKGDFTEKITREMNKQYEVKLASSKGAKASTTVASNKK